MIRVIVTERTIVDGQEHTREVELTAEFPNENGNSDGSNIEQVNKLREELQQLRESLQKANDRNKQTGV
jgi:hypothetical protein